MLFKSMAVYNYASFKSAGRLHLGPGINFIVGQNNTGKSALLKAFRPDRLANRHRDFISHRVEDLAGCSRSIELQLRPESIARLSRLHGWALHWPLGLSTEPQEVGDFFKLPSWETSLKSDENALKVERVPYATVGVNRSCSVNFNWKNQVLANENATSKGYSIDFFVQQAWQESVFWFEAQRYNLGRCSLATGAALTPEASNLAAVLMRLQGDRGDLFDALVQHMRDVFPTVRNLSVTSDPGTDQTEILVWPTVERKNRELATSLNESGTGLSQVLAILTIAMTFKESVILIDEISSFLHPAAAKSLIRILESHYPRNQYIITTHSPEVLTACTPSSIHLVTKTGSASEVTSIDAGHVDDIRRLTGELGVSLTDVFAGERVIWVEGPTEEVAFPYILEMTRQKTPEEQGQRSPQFTAVVATGDFNARRQRPELIFDIYSRLTGAVAMLPGAATFAFDSEDLSDGEKLDLRRRSGDRLRFLPRRLFECYLLHPKSIAQVINDSLGSDSVAAEKVQDFLLENGGNAAYKAEASWSNDPIDPEWLSMVDAAKLLKNLFSELSEQRLEFNKRTHSFGILKEILENDRSHIAELVAFIRELVALSRGAFALTAEF